jgi:hypothetical protein
MFAWTPFLLRILQNYHRYSAAHNSTCIAVDHFKIYMCRYRLTNSLLRHVSVTGCRKLESMSLRWPPAVQCLYNFLWKSVKWYLIWTWKWQIHMKQLMWWHHTASCFRLKEGEWTKSRCLHWQPQHSHPNANILSPLKPVGYNIYDLFSHINNLHSVHKTVWRITRTNSLYYHEQHKPVGVCNGDTVSSAR